MTIRFMAISALTVALIAAPALFAGPATAAGKRRPSAPAAPPAAAAETSKATQPIKRLIGAVRYNKDAIALAQLDGEAQARFLLEKTWDSSSPEQRKTFIKLFHGLFSAMAFPRIRKNFEKLDTVLYDPPAVSGERAKVGATIVILHPMKKQEIRATYHMHQVGQSWRVVDVTIKGDKSMLTNIRQDQIRPILAEGGMPKLLELLQKRLAQLAG